MPEPTLLSEAEAWLERAKVARWAAEELRACGHQAARILAGNYFGSNCVEAPPVFTELAAAITTGHDSWSEAINGQVELLTALGDACGAGGREFQTQDRFGAHAVGT